MLGRFITMAAIMVVGSVGVASIASRSADPAAETAPVEQQPIDIGNVGGDTGSASGVSSAGEVRLGRAADSHFYADADVDGTSIRMMVDSGASIVALTRSDAESIGINVDSLPITGTARTAGGEVPMRTVVLDSVEIDGIEVRRVDATVIDAEMGVSLLGQSFLAKLDAVNVEGDTMTLR